jgi:hypothetical protein
MRLSDILFIPAVLLSTAVGPSAHITSDEAVLDGADAISAMTLRVRTVRHEAGRPPAVTRQAIFRSRDRLLIQPDDGIVEWLFVRNPIDRRRVSGYLVDHESKHVIVHDESALRHGQHIHGWRDVFMLRFDPAVLVTLQSDGRRRTLGAIEFEHYVSPGSTTEGIIDVWWSPTALFASEVTIKQGPVTITSIVDTLDAVVPEWALSTPTVRFPSYQAFDSDDALERH